MTKKEFEELLNVKINEYEQEREVLENLDVVHAGLETFTDGFVCAMKEFKIKFENEK